MNLSIVEAARLLGKSDRQVRYLIRTGRLPARLDGKSWTIRREDLPLSEGQERAVEHKAERARQIVEEVLGPVAAPAGDEKARTRFSVKELKAFQLGAPIYRELCSSGGDAHPAAQHLREALMHLTCGCHEYHARSKAELFRAARLQAGRAVAAALLGSEDLARFADRIEAEVLPGIGGLLRHAEKRGSP